MKKSPEDIIEFITSKDIQVSTPITEITSIHDKLNLICRCGSPYSQSYRDFRQQKKYQCIKCTHEQNGKHKRNKPEDVAKLLNSVNCKLVSNYTTSHDKMAIECSCGNVYYQTLSDFLSTKRAGRPNTCPPCALMRKTQQQTLTYSAVAEFVNNTGCELLTKEYTSQNDKLQIKCRFCKTAFENTLKDFKNNGTYACSNCTRTNISTKEKQIVQFIHTMVPDYNIIENDRTILNGKELDILIPTNNVAIEYNGIYFHSEKFGKGRSYHLQKTLNCHKNGIRLFHIFENEWNHSIKKDIWKSILTSNLKKSPNKIYARNCTIQKLSSKETQKFLSVNHLQGKDKSSIRYGLIYNAELVAVMTFSKSRFSKKHDYELLRMATKKFTNVVGGASKLFSAFLKEYPNKSVVTYADLRYSIGDVYTKLGFKFTHKTPPSYFYTKQNRLYNRLNFQKHKLKHKLEIYDDQLSETENMNRNDYYRIWDCGNYAFDFPAKEHKIES